MPNKVDRVVYIDADDLPASIDLLAIGKKSSWSRSIVTEAWRRFRADEAVLDWELFIKVGNPDAR